MSVTDQPEQQDAPLLEEAMDWFILLQDAPADVDLVAEWRDWLRLSDAHAAAWAQICRTWAVLGEQAAAPPKTDAQTRRAALASRSTFPLPRRGMALGGISLMCFALVASLIGPTLLIRFQSDFRTGPGETQIVTLVDGSRVALAPETALADEFDEQTRHIRLLAGEAYFEVERDITRPFVVDAPDVSVRVLGTAFGVRDTGQGTRVELAHGSIALKAHGPDGAAELTLAPGDVVTVEREGGKTEMNRVDPAEIALWREGRLSVTDQPLGDVVALIQRHHPAWILLPERDLAALRVTGLYDLKDPDKALMALAAPFGLKMRAATPYLRILSRQ